MATGVLPFDRDGEIRAQDGTQVPDTGDSDLPCGVWKVSQSTSNVGATYDYRGIVKARTPDELAAIRTAIMGKQNRTLEVSPSLGVVGLFKIVEATEHTALGYFELLLRVSAANG